MNYIIITKKIWTSSIFSKLDKKFQIEKSINLKKIKALEPKIIFFVFWSKKIPKALFENYLCIQFHTADLPKFRGGSPVQNQIIRGIINTKISAFKINSKIDSGEICLKKKIMLIGSAQEIFKNIEIKVLDMIKELTIKRSIKFVKQKGKVSFFKRRKKSDSRIDLKKVTSIKNFFNLIRATDAEGYTKAYLDFNNFKIELFNARLFKNYLNAEISIKKKK